jgi:hypothetical protein
MQQLVLPVLFLASALQSGGTTQREVAAVHLQRVVHCGTNLDIVVFPSGAVYEDEEDGCVTPKSDLRLHHLRPERIAEILRLAESLRFFSLPELIDPKTIIADEDYVIIRVRSGGRDKTVRSAGLDRSNDPDAASRFQRLWDAVSALVRERK